MGPDIFKYALLLAFVGLTFWLSWVGMQKAKSIKGFAIGNGDMSPILVGITMASSTASTALFVINPGFIYVDGLSAYLHFVFASFGSFSAILLLTKKFRVSGGGMGSITIPGWIYDRYKHRGMSLFFALVNLLMVSFVVLILSGSAILLSLNFPISEKAALVCCLFFVFSYVLMGGVYAHAYTNAFQGGMMFVIAIFLFIHGVTNYVDGDSVEKLQSISEHYLSVYNPDSLFFNSFVSVFLASFVVTFALMLQPHILTKVLYLKDDKQVSTFIWTSVIVGSGYTLVLLLGFFAQLSGMPPVAQDFVVPVYLSQAFSTGIGPYISAFITVTLLAAGLSTLDGILVSLSAMTVNDIYHPFAKPESTEEYARRGLMLSRLVLIVIGLVALAIAWDKPELLGIFAQQGIYALAAASMVPILVGVMGQKDVNANSMFVCAVIGLVGHFLFMIAFGIRNPAVSAAYAIFASAGAYILMYWGLRMRAKEAA